MRSLFRLNPAMPVADMVDALWGTAPAPLRRWLDKSDDPVMRAILRARRAGFSLVAGGGEGGASPEARTPLAPLGAGADVDLGARIAQLTDPRSREVRTVAGGGGIPMTGISLDYTETGLLPEHYPFRSVADAQKAMEWINRKVAAGRGREFTGPYYKAVVNVTWMDGSRWRGRFDADGVGTSVPDLFGSVGIGGGITWENTTDKGKVYARDTVFEKVPPFVPPSDAGGEKEATTMMAAFERVRKAGWRPGVIYAVPRHGRADDTFQDEDRWYKLLGLKDARTANIEVLRQGETTPQSSTMGLLYLLELPREKDKQGYPRELHSWPEDSGARRLRDIVSGGAGPENAVIKAVLQTLAPGTAWTVRGSTGTAYGWTDVSGKGGDPARAEAAVKAMGFIGPADQASRERYHLFVPSEALAVARQTAERAKALAAAAETRKVAEPETPPVSAMDWRVGDVLVRQGQYQGPALIDVVRIRSIEPSTRGGAPTFDFEHLALSDTHRRTRVIMVGERGNRKTVEATDFTPKRLEREGGALVRKYLPEVGTARVLLQVAGATIADPRAKYRVPYARAVG